MSDDKRLGEEPTRSTGLSISPFVPLVLTHTHESVE